MTIKNDVRLAFHGLIKCMLAYHQLFILSIGTLLVICIVWRNYFIGTKKSFDFKPWRQYKMDSYTSRDVKNSAESGARHLQLT